jgi:hypothetical protein
MTEAILVREWDSDAFHKRVLELESDGYVPRSDSYRITPEMDPETGAIIHLHSIEMVEGGEVEHRLDG